MYIYICVCVCVHHCHILRRNSKETVQTQKSTDAHILASASTSLLSKFQDRALRLPGPNLYSRTFLINHGDLERSSSTCTQLYNSIKIYKHTTEHELFLWSHTQTNYICCKTEIIAADTASWIPLHTSIITFTSEIKVKLLKITHCSNICTVTISHSRFSIKMHSISDFLLQYLILQRIYLESVL